MDDLYIENFALKTKIEKKPTIEKIEEVHLKDLPFTSASENSHNIHFYLDMLQQMIMQHCENPDYLQKLVDNVGKQVEMKNKEEAILLIDELEEFLEIELLINRNLSY